MNKLKSVYEFATDRANITLLLFVSIALAITWATVNQIEYNYRLEQQSVTLQQEVDLLNQQIANQTLQNEYYQSEYYQELAARQQLGLVDPGEKVAVINQQKINDILANFEPELTELEEKTLGQASALEQWSRFFSGKKPL